MISKELKSQLSILKETNLEYIQTLKDAVTASYKAELQAIKPSSTEEEELNPYLRYPNQRINNNHLHSEHIRLQIRDIPLTDISI